MDNGLIKGHAYTITNVKKVFKNTTQFIKFIKYYIIGWVSMMPQVPANICAHQLDVFILIKNTIFI